MNRLRKILLLALVPTALISSGNISVALAQDRTSDDSTPTPASILALHVAEIASSTKMSSKEKQRRISGLLRAAVLTATTDVSDPAQALALALDLAKAAARAAPDYTQSIISTVESIPSIASINGAMAAVQAAVLAAATPGADEPAAAGTQSKFASSPTPTPPGINGGGGADVVVSPSQ